MYENLISNYVSKMTEEDIQKFASSKGINISEADLPIIYEYTKKHWKEFYEKNASKVLEELKPKISLETYNKIEDMYSDYLK